MVSIVRDTCDCCGGDGAVDTTTGYCRDCSPRMFYCESCGQCDLCCDCPDYEDDDE